MGLFAELQRPQPAIPHPVLPKLKSALELQVEEIRRKFGGATREPEPASDHLAMVETMLGDDGSGVDRLGRRELRIVPYIIWGANSAWRRAVSFIRRFLARVEQVWPKAPRRLWVHYVMNFDPECAASAELAQWLERRVLDLPEPLQKFSAIYNLFDLKHAPPLLAKAAILDPSLLQDLEELGTSPAMFRSSTLMLSVIEASGPILAMRPDLPDAPTRLTDLLGGEVEFALDGSGNTELRSRALRAIVDGVVAWQERQAQNSSPEPALDFLIKLNGDPRFKALRWTNKVSAESLSVIRRWLSRKTLEAFFRIIDALQTDRRDMWQERREFWLSYLPHITDAWLVVGKKAVPIAVREGLDFGQFASGGGVQSDHCGLMMQIGSIRIMEMNKNGRAFFWNVSNKSLPDFYQTQKTYDRQIFIARANVSSENYGGNPNRVSGLTHHGGWQDKFCDELLERTGIDRPR
ncbi:EH signature domain-containing protein [Pseudoroseomonas ludipueritiae]|uniref:Zorya protein ZorC EH domain-containing protein n=1 Tax=Pseudoroseomonas ludipueritiae TaxID=198093 RepID=A0ABR7R3F3_9PROT|nr:EH signature domain-containing protein [Pseudoroseomonas ludipueritiae]MBC9176145.1 hypothetical protein [Pseudoroseomonas ludipueritiae]